MKIVSAYNLKGGVGKTTTVVNLAFVAAGRGVRVLVWDLDPQAATTYYLGAKPNLKGGAKRVVKTKSGILRAVKETDFANLSLVPADFSLRKMDAALRKHRGLNEVLKPLHSDYDLVICDCPPAAGRLIREVVDVSTVTLVPVVPTTLAVRTYHQIRAQFDGELGRRLIPFFNLVDRRKRMHRELCIRARLEDVAFLETIIPNSSRIEKMGEYRAPVGAHAASSREAIAYERLWDEVDNLLRSSGPWSQTQVV